MQYRDIMGEFDDAKQMGLEYLILLVLGCKDEIISMLHLEKELFLLWNFHPGIRKYMKFIKHYKGPFSREVQECVIHPFYLENCWEYIPPKKYDRLSGGYIKLTEKGKEEYKKFVNEILKSRDNDLIHLLAGIKIVRNLYDKLSFKELLLLIYDTYPEYTEKSSVYWEIKKEKDKLAKNLMKKKVIDEDRYKSLVENTVK
jgi:hypothetical protein